MKITTNIEEHQIIFRLGSYFMAAVWAAASYSRGGFSLCHAGSAWRVMIPDLSTFNLESGTIILVSNVHTEPYPIL